MVRYDNRHSAIVAWAKIALPLVALGILSTVFLVSRPIDPEATLPYTEAELENLLQEDRLRDPAYAGVTRDGSALSVAADQARPDGTGRGRAEGLVALIEMPNGARLEMAAGAGAVDNEARIARLEDGVELHASTGYDLWTDAVTAHFEQTLVESDGRVTADGPPGRIVAGRMVLRQDAAGRYLLDFTDGVRLLYFPPTTEQGGP